MPLQEVQELFVFEEAGLLDDLDVGLGPPQHQYFVQHELPHLRPKKRNVQAVRKIWMLVLGRHSMSTWCRRRL